MGFSTAFSRLTDVQKTLLIVTVAGLVVRYVLGVFLTYPRDITTWLLNSENFLSGEGLYGLPGHYYSPVWGYIMALVTAVAGFIGIPMSHYVTDIGGSLEHWNLVLPSIEYALLVKTFLFVADILVGYVIYRICMHVRGDERLAVLMYSLWVLCPLTIIMSSIRVMFENVEILFMLLSVLMMLERRPVLAGAAMGISLMVKPYGLFLAGLMIGYSYAQSNDHRYTLKYFLSAAAMVLLLMLPVIMSGHLDESLLWLSTRTGNLEKNNNLSVLITPFLVVLTLVTALWLARTRNSRFDVLMWLSLAYTSAMLIIPGNIQYYLLLLPLAMLTFSRVTVAVAYVMILLLSVYSGLSFTQWSSEVYVSYGFWGSEALDSFAKWVGPFESHIYYNTEKTLTSLLCIAVSAVGLLRSGRGVRG